MEDTFKISFCISPFQEFNYGSIVTYKDENLLEYIKESLYSRSNFFFIDYINWNEYQCKISNGIDLIESTPDQLIQITSYIEKIKTNFPDSEFLLKEEKREYIETKIEESYLLEDQKMSIVLENSIIPREYFVLVNKIVNVNSFVKNYQVARFYEEMILDII